MDYNNPQEDIEQKLDSPDVPFLQHQFNREEYNQWGLVPWFDQEDQEKYAPFGTHNEQPIFGPPAMHQIWPDDTPYIGTDWEMPPPEGQPLNPKQLQLCYSHLISNVIFKNKLGEGNFGTVWDVNADYRPHELNQWKRLRFACKVIRHEYLNHFYIKASLNELLVLQYLRHENICNLADCVGIPDTRTHFPYAVVCLFLEYCHGNLGQIVMENKPEYFDTSVEKWTLPEQLSRHWFVQIMRALEYIHSKKVIHSDIHIGNILYRYTEDQNTYEERFLCATFKLADFGISPTFADDPDEDFDEEQNSDIKALIEVLLYTGIPGPVKSNDQFIEFCSGNESEDYPESWNTISTPLKDFIFYESIEDKSNALRILQEYSWLKEIEDPRTEIFTYKPKDLYKSHKIKTGLQYKNWEQQREDPHLPYAPFGWAYTTDQRFWDDVNFDWRRHKEPLHGTAPPPEQP